MHALGGITCHTHLGVRIAGLVQVAKTRRSHFPPLPVPPDPTYARMTAARAFILVLFSRILGAEAEAYQVLRYANYFQIWFRMPVVTSVGSIDMQQVVRIAWDATCVGGAVEGVNLDRRVLPYYARVRAHCTPVFMRGLQLYCNAFVWNTAPTLPGL